MNETMSRYLYAVRELQNNVDALNGHVEFAQAIVYEEEYDHIDITDERTARIRQLTAEVNAAITRFQLS